MPKSRFRSQSRPASGQIVDPASVVVDFPLVRGIEGSQNVQQRALARAALADDGQQLALPDAEAHAMQDRDNVGPLAIALVHVDRQQLVRGGARAGPSVVAARRYQAEMGANRLSGAAGRLSASERVIRGMSWRAARGSACGHRPRLLTHSGVPPRVAAGRHVGPAGCLPPRQSPARRTRSKSRSAAPRSRESGRSSRSTDRTPA